MASTQTRQLRELLQEEQEPFVLESYLAERGCSKTSSRPKPSKVSRIKKGIIYSSKLLKSMYKKLVRTTKSSRIKNCDDKDGEEAMEPDSDKEETSTSLHDQDQTLLLYSSSSTRCCEGTEITAKSTSLHDQDQTLLLHSSPSSTRSCEETEITTKGQEQEDSILTASLFGLLVCSTTQKPGRVQAFELQDLVHCKTVLMQSQQLMFDCVRELVEGINGRRKRNGGEFLGSEEIGKLVLEKMKDWGKQSGKEKNMNMEFGDSVDDDHWSHFRPQKSEVEAAIGDKILEELKNQLVIDLLCR